MDFYDVPAVRLLGNLEDDPPRFLGVSGPMNFAAYPLDAGFQLDQVAVQIGKRVLLDALGVVAQRTAVGEGEVAPTVAGQQCVGEPAESNLEWRIGRAATADALRKS